MIGMLLMNAQHLLVLLEMVSSTNNEGSNEHIPPAALTYAPPTALYPWPPRLANLILLPVVGSRGMERCCDSQGRLQQRL